MLEEILNMLFPPTCGFCGELDKEYFCENCKKKLEKQISSKIHRPEGKYFDKQIAIFSYDGITREEILKYKFKRQIIYV
ncbi:MAG: hypothetical protein HFJ51_02955 [Clostridia bacterium]|nr:hypothetical protein [Clostridia bacterium]